tara:strand:- start:268 stop:1149 length:882 start_codon:yes stop_codon:yes gene_type:complete
MTVLQDRCPPHIIAVRASDVATAIGRGYGGETAQMELVKKLITGCIDEILPSVRDSHAILERWGGALPSTKEKKCDINVHQSSIVSGSTEDKEDAQDEESQLKLRQLAQKCIKKSLKLAIECKHSDEVTQQEQRVLKDVLTVAPSCDTGALRRHVAKERGICGEKRALDALEAKCNIVVNERNRELKSHTFAFGVRVTGCIDGKTHDGTLVEAKERRYKLLGVPYYERIQCEVYLRLFDMHKCCLTERFNDQSKEYVFMRDDRLWSEITEGLREFKELFKRESGVHGKPPANY